LQLLDPDARWRRTRVAICSAAIALAGFRLTSGETDWAIGAAALTAILALGAAVLRSLHAFHFRALPLALPFYCVGLAAEGHIAAAGAGLAVLLLATFGLSHAAPPARLAR
ncbi:MAG: hypothetical protein IH797_07410, partial [Chloroflexi bacterium]|nr:hypothetical protein [Chloroflexota bacterium]